MIAIIGGGLSGTSIAKLCIERQIEFEWYIDAKPNASAISSGIINPITGRNLVLSWQYDKFLSIAKPFYSIDNIEFIEAVEIEKWIQDEVLYKDICLDIEHREAWIDLLLENKILIKNSYQVKVPEFIDCIINKCSKQLKREAFNYDLLEIQQNELRYKDSVYQKVICCDGIEVLNNPFFNHLPFIPNRGEALEIKSSEYNFQKIVHRGKMLCKYKQHYWVGSTFDRVPVASPLTTDSVFKELKESSDYFFNSTPYDIVNHLGAMRCTVRDRRPIIDRHPEYSNLYVFNGFGTKGSSMIPYFATQLLNHLETNTPMDTEVSIRRFKEFRN